MVLFVVHNTDEVADVITAFFLEMPTQHGKAGWLERWKATPAWYYWQTDPVLYLQQIYSKMIVLHDKRRPRLRGKGIT
jgi:hypothetical protein